MKKPIGSVSGPFTGKSTGRQLGEEKGRKRGGGKAPRLKAEKKEKEGREKGEILTTLSIFVFRSCGWTPQRTGSTRKRVRKRVRSIAGKKGKAEEERS